eukprot:TRINITY_DN38886_c0_g1_i2.p1 TRINITY_DN38886_c0_g1~~TRINITY_DN38886_c0_g1_i2.p1  ORF type:complete len:170 (+),score=16.56 TRINITY_DN38886_c0_g1_i2:34-510(+)
MSVASACGIAVTSFQGLCATAFFNGTAVALAYPAVQSYRVETAPRKDQLGLTGAHMCFFVLGTGLPFLMVYAGLDWRGMFVCLACPCAAYAIATYMLMIESPELLWATQQTDKMHDALLAMRAMNQSNVEVPDAKKFPPHPPPWRREGLAFSTVLQHC